MQAKLRTVVGASMIGTTIEWFDFFIYGVAADDLDSVKRLPLVQSVAGYDAQYKPVPTKLRIDGPMVTTSSRRSASGTGYMTAVRSDT